MKNLYPKIFHVELMKTITVRLQCQIRSIELSKTLNDYENDRLYYVNDDKLPLSLAESLKVRNHSPSGFNHGYGGSCPAQLALAVCLRIYPDKVAEQVYQFFKDEFIAALPNPHQEFNLRLEVPVDPIVYWDLPFYSSYEETEAENEYPDEEPTAEIELWEKELANAYRSVNKLPGAFRYDFIGYHNYQSCCYLRIINPNIDDGKVTVITTDINEEIKDAGTSITNSAEQLTTQVCQEHEIPSQKLRWIERYVRKPSACQLQRQQPYKFEEEWS
ncbi:hypothetical protein OKW21_006635 [Catalinimonas alkaloidigena]|uniref:DUF6166 domain-containing protein n=1 Tax=Catalinimonas alkaloidigena TaxID=1075417 RepID=UPI0024072C3F|nr:DUF6166 domain-containing protein [Catalinimonas alkaloidigena]MDF9801326.1 hypothetical protein [Catalinimonas alkaloidigena]